MLFENNIFAPRSVEDDRTLEVLNAATDRATVKIRPSDLLASVIKIEDAKALATLAQALKPGCTVEDLQEFIEFDNPSRSTPSDFDGRREWFSPEALTALDQFDAELDELSKKGEGAGGATLELLLSYVLSQLAAENNTFLETIDVERGVQLFRKQVKIATKSPNPLFDNESGRLRSDEFSEDAWKIMEHAGSRAADLGYDRILLPHCFLALLGETEGVAERLVRLQAQPEIGPGKVVDIIATTFRLSDRQTGDIDLNRNGVGEITVKMLEIAQKTAQLWGSEQIDTAHLLSAVMDEMPPLLESVLEQNPLNLDLEKMREHLDQHLRSCPDRAD